MGLTVYHLSSDINNIIEEFVPRIPYDSPFIDENKTIPRICVSLNIPGAMTGKPKKVAEQVLGEVYRVYEFDIDYPHDPDYVGYRTIYENEYVKDALLTKECWLTRRIKPTRTYLIKITKISQELTPAISYSKLKEYLHELEFDPDNSDEWLNDNDGFLQSAFDRLHWINLETNEPGYDYNMINEFWSYKNK